MTTVLLLHFDGVEGSTSYPDATGRHTVVNDTGSAADITTLNSYFGNACLHTDTLNDHVICGGGSDFTFDANTDFIIDFRVRSYVIQNHAYVDFRAAEPDTGPLIFSTAASSHRLMWWVNGVAQITGTTSLTDPNRWYHVLVSRVAGQTRLFVNGIQEGSTYADTNNYTCISDGPRIGGSFDNTFGGKINIDEFRIVKGYGISSNFIPPAQPYSPDNFYVPSPIYTRQWTIDYDNSLRFWTGVVPSSAPTPFSQADWPLPTGFARPVTLRTTTVSYNPNLVGQDKLPFSQNSWPLTIDARYDVGLRSWFGAVPSTAGPAPFSQTDWPVPIDPRYDVGLRRWFGAIPPTPPPVIEYVFGGPLYTNPRGPEYHVQLRSWFGAIPPAPAAAPFAEYDWPNPRGHVYPVDTRTVTESFNLNLIGQDKLPTGETVSDLPPRAPLQPTPIFTASYNKNLIGQDKLPTGEAISDIPPQPPLSAIQLRTWINAVNLALATLPPARPFNQYDWPINTGPQQPVQILTASYNKNLIGQDLLPFNQDYWPLTPAAQRPTNLLSWIDRVKLLLLVPFKQTDWPVPVPPRPPGQTWLYSYNLNLIGKDQLPTGEVISDLPPQPPLSSIQLRTWLSFVSLALVTPPAPRPFAQSDWPLNFGPLQPIKTFTASYNINLIGQDKLPSGEIFTDLPPRAALQPIPIFTATYNQNLIGQDKLPTGEAVSDLPPQPALSSIQLRTWLQTVNLALVVQAAKLPFNQYDWPINTGPRQSTQIFTASYNRNLVGQDRLPFRQQDWPLPTPKPRPLDLVTWIDRAKSYLQIPLRQLDWPVPRGYQQPALSYTASYNPNLIGKDRLPNRQQDWPLPRDPRRLSDWIVPTNPNLFPPPPPLLRPFNQFYWPVPLGATPGYEQRYTTAYQGNNLLPYWVSPIPPVPPPTPPTSEPFRHTPGLEWQHFDRIREPGPMGWR